MGLLSKIFTRASRSESAELDVELDELESWLSGRRKEEFKSILSEGDRFGREMAGVSQDLIAMGSELASATIKESKQIKELNANIQSAKSTVAKKLVTAFSTIKPWSLGTFEEMIIAQKNVAQTLNGVAGVIKAHGRYVTYFFKVELRKIQTELSKMEKLSSTMAKLISDSQPRFDTITDLIRDAKRYRSIKTSIIADKATLVELNKTVTASQRDLSNLLSKITELEQTKGFKASSGTKMKIDGLASELSGLESSFEADLTRISKPLRKYLYSASLNKAQQTLLDNYLRSPSTTLLSDSELALISILNDLKQGLGTLIGNPKQSEKMKKFVEDLISSIPDTHKQLHTLTKQIDENRAISFTEEVKNHGDLKAEDLRMKKIIEEDLNRVKQLTTKIDDDELILNELSTKTVEKTDELFSLRVHTNHS